MAYEPKTTKTKASVTDFLARIPREETRRDCAQLVKLMRKVTGEPAAMWGPSIVGFGTYTYVYASGHSGDWPLVGFSPRKQDLTLYVWREFEGAPALMKKLGRYRTGKVCLYLKSLADVDSAVLEELIRGSVADTRKRYPPVKPAGAKAARAKAAKSAKAAKKAPGKKLREG